LSIKHIHKGEGLANEDIRTVISKKNLRKGIKVVRTFWNKQVKNAKQDMKIISKKYLQDIRNFVEQISIKFGDVYLNKTNLVQTVL